MDIGVCFAGTISTLIFHCTSTPANMKCVPSKKNYVKNKKKVKC